MCFLILVGTVSSLQVTQGASQADSSLVNLSFTSLCPGQPDRAAFSLKRFISRDLWLKACCTTRQQLQHDSRKNSVGGTYKMVLPSYFCWWPQGTIDLLTIKPGYCSYDMLQYVTIQFCCPFGGPPCKDGPWYYIPWAKPDPLGQRFCGMDVPLPRQQLLGGPVTTETAMYKPSWICWRNPTPTSKKTYRFASRTGSPIEQKTSHRQTAKQSLETWRSQA